MGMFDWVRCDYPLPVAEHRDVQSWQTKSFQQPALRHFAVTEDGRLLIHGVDADPPFSGVVELLELNEDETEQWRYWLTFADGRIIDVRGETQPGLSAEYEEVDLHPLDDERD